MFMQPQLCHVKLLGEDHLKAQNIHTVKTVIRDLQFDLDKNVAYDRGSLNTVSTRTGTEGDKNTPKPGHGHGINTDKQKK